MSSVRTGWLVALAGFVLGAPLFVRLPPWTDLTLYQTAADSWLRGGTPYRDVFDTNLPGFPALLMLTQAVTGPSNFAARVLDLLVVGSACATLAVWARRGGAGPGATGWYAAGCVWFYLFTSEFVHVQRDAWMLLPASLAGWWRTRRLGEGRARPLAALGEGIVWGLAVWIKPHVVVPAFALWAAALPLALRAWGRGGVLRDTLALSAGGLLTGGLGLALIARSGAWRDFWEVMLVWNPAYTRGALAELPHRATLVFAYFAPWTYLLVPAGVVAALHLWRASKRPGCYCAAKPAEVAPRVTLAAFAVAWFLQALVIQKGNDYVHVPEIFLALALLAGQNFAPARWVISWTLLQGLAFAAADRSPELMSRINGLPRSWNLPYGRPPAFDPFYLQRWRDCFRGDTPELRDALARMPRVCCTASWVELEHVARYLEQLPDRPRDGELLAFHDGPHPLYLRLGIRPAARFLHVGTACLIPGMGDKVGEEIRAADPKFVVSDLARETTSARRAVQAGPGGDPLALPAWLPRDRRRQFPFDRPIVYRFGRYAVHRVGDEPIGVVTVPAWEDLKQ